MKYNKVEVHLEEDSQKCWVKLDGVPIPGMISFKAERGLRGPAMITLEFHASVLEIDGEARLATAESAL